jgi:hypothetical protein
MITYSIDLLYYTDVTKEQQRFWKKSLNQTVTYPKVCL